MNSKERQQRAKAHIIADIIKTENIQNSPNLMMALTAYMLHVDVSLDDTAALKVELIELGVL